MTDDLLPVPGMVIDTEEVDAKLIRLRMRGSAHFTGGDLDAIQTHYGKSINDLTDAEKTIATAYIYLRRAGVEGANWDMAANDVAMEGDEEIPLANGDTLGTSPPSATTGDALPATSIE